LCGWYLPNKTVLGGLAPVMTAKFSFHLIALFSVSITLAGTGRAQRPDLPPEIKAELAKSPVPPPPNDKVGIVIDRFIGNPFQAQPRVIHGVIIVRPMLRHGDPYRPGETGAVLEYRKEVAEGTILPFKGTALVEAADQQFWYVESGKGRLDDGERYWDLREGIGALIPPRAKHRIVNTADEPLQLLMLTYLNTDGFTPRKDILVRDVHAMPLPPAPAHWNYFGTDFFSPEDGLHPNEQFAVVYMPPMTISEPHAHIPKWEEIWVKLPPHSSFLMLGSEVREMPPNTAFLAPPNSRTVHSVVNLTKDKTQAFMYLGRHGWKQQPHPERPIVEPRPLKRP
jgi:mannose-6-phosphate isomerase-like protein (cupin superfamily)